METIAKTYETKRNVDAIFKCDVDAIKDSNEAIDKPKGRESRKRQLTTSCSPPEMTTTVFQV